jgi:hypothetical protein
MSGACGVSARPPSSIRRRNSSTNTRCKLMSPATPAARRRASVPSGPGVALGTTAILASVERKTSRKLGTAPRTNQRAVCNISRQRGIFRTRPAVQLPSDVLILDIDVGALCSIRVNYRTHPPHSNQPCNSYRYGSVSFGDVRSASGKTSTKRSAISNAAQVAAHLPPQPRFAVSAQPRPFPSPVVDNPTLADVASR